MAIDPGSVERARIIQRIMGKKYTIKLSRMSVLPVLSELPEGAHSHTLVAPSLMAALPFPPPRPTAPVNLPDVQRSQRQQLKARNDLVDFANVLVIKNARLSSHLRGADARSVSFAKQLEQQKKDSLALEESIHALWSLVQPGSLLSTTQICEQIKVLASINPQIFEKTTQMPLPWGKS